MNTIAERRTLFAELHQAGCFVIPNPWDVGSALFLRHLGFQALATTSAGFQFTLGQADKVWGLPLEAVLAHVKTIVEATDLPVNADFQSGYAHEPEGVADNVSACVATGVAGLSIEDATGEAGQLYELPLAVERIRAARTAIDDTAERVLLTGRAESFLVGHPNPLEDAVTRLTAYAEAGADVLFAPGRWNREELRTLVDAVAPKPFNAIMMGGMGITLAELAEIGVRRVSVGSALARTAWGSFIRAARQIAEEGRFDGLGDAASFEELNAVFEKPADSD